MVYKIKSLIKNNLRPIRNFFVGSIFILILIDISLIVHISIQILCNQPPNSNYNAIASLLGGLVAAFLSINLSIGQIIRNRTERQNSIIMQTKKQLELISKRYTEIYQLIFLLNYAEQETHKEIKNEMIEKNSYMEIFRLKMYDYIYHFSNRYLTFLPDKIHNQLTNTSLESTNYDFKMDVIWTIDEIVNSIFRDIELLSVLVATDNVDSLIVDSEIKEEVFELFEVYCNNLINDQLIKIKYPSLTNYVKSRQVMV
jgi:hypothetical protein